MKIGWRGMGAGIYGFGRWLGLWSDVLHAVVGFISVVLGCLFGLWVFCAITIIYVGYQVCDLVVNDGLLDFLLDLLEYFAGVIAGIVICMCLR